MEYETCNLDPCPAWIADAWSPVKSSSFVVKICFN
jgi:hypothetical protein